MKNIVAILLILVLLPATGGISIYHHICNLDGEHNTALFAQTSCSHHQHDNCDCAEQSTSNCSLEENDHCVEFVEYVSIDAKFVVEKDLVINKSEFYTEYISINISSDDSKILKKIVFPDKSKIPITEYIKFQNFQSRNKSSEEAG